MKNLVKSFFDEIYTTTSESFYNLFVKEDSLKLAWQGFLFAMFFMSGLIAFVVLLTLLGVVFFMPSLVALSINAANTTPSSFIIFMLVTFLLTAAQSIQVIDSYSSYINFSWMKLAKIVLKNSFLSWGLAGVMGSLALAVCIVLSAINGNIDINMITSWEMWATLITQTYTLLWIYLAACKQKDKYC